MLRAVTSRWRAVRARWSSTDADALRRRAEFTGIFEQNAWGDPESVSGPGSNVARASLFRADLEALVRSIKPRTLLDAPCGDFNWLRHFDLGIERYVGIDIVPALIARNRARFGSRSEERRVGKECRS